MHFLDRAHPALGHHHNKRKDLWKATSTNEKRVAAADPLRHRGLSAAERARLEARVCFSHAWRGRPYSALHPGVLRAPRRSPTLAAAGPGGPSPVPGGGASAVPGAAAGAGAGAAVPVRPQASRVAEMEEVVM